MSHIVPLYRSQMRTLHRLQWEDPISYAVLHEILRLMGSHTALVASYGALADALGCSPGAVGAAIRVLKRRRLIETLRVASIHAFIVHRRGERKRRSDGSRGTLLDAVVIASRDDRAEGASAVTLEETPRMLQIPERGRVIPDCPPLRGEQLALNLE